MLLIAIIALTVAAILLTVGEAIRQRDTDWLALTTIAAVGGMTLALMAAQIVQANPRDERPGEHIDLAALGSTSNVSGSFFLGSGYIDQEQTFAYIADHGGYYTRESVPAEDSRIYISDEPGLETTYRCNTNRWLTPWDLCGYVVYNFYVPEGSVLESYEVTP